MRWGRCSENDEVTGDIRWRERDISGEGKEGKKGRRGNAG